MPDIDDLLRAPAWLSNRSSACATCDVKQRVAESPLQPHYQSIMERLDHLPPHTMVGERGQRALQPTDSCARRDSFFRCCCRSNFRATARARVCCSTRTGATSVLAASCTGSRCAASRRCCSALAAQVAFTAAFLTNRTLVVLEQDGWLWAERRLCGRRTLSCYFEPLSSCQALSDDSLRALLAPQRRESVPLLDPALLGDEWHRDVRVVAWRSDGGLARTVPGRRVWRTRTQHDARPISLSLAAFGVLVARALDALDFPTAPLHHDVDRIATRRCNRSGDHARARLGALSQRRQNTRQLVAGGRDERHRRRRCGRTTATVARTVRGFVYFLSR